MKQEYKELLLKDLCARFPYDVKLHIPSFSDTPQLLQQISNYGTIEINEYVIDIDKVKPYLRPMSSMTEEEKRELQSYYPGGFGNQWFDVEKGIIDIFECSSTITLYLCNSQRIIDWLDKKMFDYRGLIPKGLAIAVTEENNPYKN